MGRDGKGCLQNAAKIIDSLPVLKNVLAGLCMSQLSASPCISNRMAHQRGMETDSLNRYLYYS